MALIDDVKIANRISSNDTDLVGELQLLIDTARLDLVTAGVGKTAAMADEPDPMIRTAIVLYSKAGFGFDNPEADRFAAAYAALKRTLSLMPDYMEAPNEPV